MQSIRQKIELLRKRKAEVAVGGGAERVKTQHKLGKLTARERLEKLYDGGAYDELYGLAKHRATSFGMAGKELAGDGVVTAFGGIDGRAVYSCSQDFTVMGGSVGEMHAWKICEVMDMALKCGAPFIAINDSGGARIQEGVDSLRGYGNIFYYNTLLSGVVPQIAIVAGPCAGGAAYSPALMNFIIMVKNTSQMFIAGPDVIKEATGEVISAEELGGAVAQSAISGNVHFIAENDQHAIEIARTLLSYLPLNNTEDPPRTKSNPAWPLEDEALNSILPDDHRESYDMFEVLKRVLDPGSIFEVYAHFAPNMITTFARIEGRVVGVIANQPKERFGAIDIDAADKAALFVRFCNAFNIPLINIVDVPGYLPGVEQEHSGIIRHGAKMLFALSAATVPKLTVVLRKAYGGAYLAMGGKALGVDRVAAWPSAEIAVMGAEGAVSILFKSELGKASDRSARRTELLEKYREEFSNPYQAAAKGMVDAVIEPKNTRGYLNVALESLRAKRELRPPKKHGLIPM